MHGRAAVIAVLVIAAAMVAAYIATQPKPTLKVEDEVSARRELISLQTRLEQFSWTVGGLTLVAIVVGLFMPGLWAAFPFRRYMYPALVVTGFGTLLLGILVLSRVWAPASIVFGYSPHALSSTIAARHLTPINWLAGGLVGIPIVVGLLAYCVHRVLALWASPASRARRATI